MCFYYNLDNVVEELMEDMDAYTTDPNEPENDSDDVDPLWEPEQLKRDYEKTADDDDNLTRRQYVFKQI